jgi:hypothetical protein
MTDGAILVHKARILNVQGAGGVGQAGIHTAEPFVPESSACNVQIAIRKLTVYKSPGVDHILAKLIQAGGKYCILRSTNLSS